MSNTTDLSSFERYTTITLKRESAKKLQEAKAQIRAKAQAQAQAQAQKLALELQEAKAEAEAQALAQAQKLALELKEVQRQVQELKNAQAQAQAQFQTQAQAQTQAQPIEKMTYSELGNELEKLYKEYADTTTFANYLVINSRNPNVKRRKKAKTSFVDFIKSLFESNAPKCDNCGGRACKKFCFGLPQNNGQRRNGLVVLKYKLKVIEQKIAPLLKEKWQRDDAFHEKRMRERQTYDCEKNRFHHRRSRSRSQASTSRRSRSRSQASTSRRSRPSDSHTSRRSRSRSQASHSHRKSRATESRRRSRSRSRDRTQRFSRSHNESGYYQEQYYANQHGSSVLSPYAKPYYPDDCANVARAIAAIPGPNDFLRYAQPPPGPPPNDYSQNMQPPLAPPPPPATNSHDPFVAGDGFIPLSQ